MVKGLHTGGRAATSETNRRVGDPPHTRKHESWLNMAEIELSVLAQECLDRRIETKEELER